MAVYNINGSRIDTGGGQGNILSVKDFGAVGDGVTDDTTKIQDALDSISNTGGLLLFPEGIYLVSSKLIFYSNQSLVFEKGAVIKQGAAIDCLLMSYCASSVSGYNGTHDAYIIGATFDGGTYTTNNTLVGIVHSKNITFDSCCFVNAYGIWHDMEINSSYNIKVINCDFEGTRKTGVNGELIQIDGINNTSTWPWSDNRGQIDNTVSKYIEIAGCIFHNDTIAPAIGNHNTPLNSYLRIHDNVFDGLTSSRGAINLQSADNVDIYNNTFNGCTTGIGTSTSSYFITGNRFTGATTAVSGAGEVHSNIINGSYTA